MLIAPRRPRKEHLRGLRAHHQAAQRVLRDLQLTPAQAEIAGKVLEEVRQRIHFLHEVGLDYLTLDRLTSTLSGGESQRIQLATSLGSRLVGALYVLDEPSIGLHTRDTAQADPHPAIAARPRQHHPRRRARSRRHPRRRPPARSRPRRRRTRRPVARRGHRRRSHGQPANPSPASTSPAGCTIPVPRPAGTSPATNVSRSPARASTTCAASMSRFRSACSAASPVSPVLANPR